MTVISARYLKSDLSQAFIPFVLLEAGAFIYFLCQMMADCLPPGIHAFVLVRALREKRSHNFTWYVDFFIFPDSYWGRRHWLEYKKKHSICFLDSCIYLLCAVTLSR